MKAELKQNGYFVKDGKLYKKAFVDAKGRLRKEKEIKCISFKNGTGQIAKGFLLNLNGVKKYVSINLIKQYV